MAKRYNQSPVTTGVTRFTKSPMAEVEFSRMVANPRWFLDLNAGDIVPVYYSEVLPHDTFSVDLDFVLRQATVLFPTMGSMNVDFYAYFVPNRIVNDSWKNVQGENTSGFWTAPEVSLAPLYAGDNDVQIPIYSVADLYGFPTQLPIKADVLKRCNDLKFRGYLEIYNNYFRDENYQPPIPYSKLNVYNGFLQSTGSIISLNPDADPVGGPDKYISWDTPADGSVYGGAIIKALYGDGARNVAETTSVSRLLTSWSALDRPLKANKLHDFITSGLPSPQKGAEVYFGIGDTADVDLYASNTLYDVGDIITLGYNGAPLNRLADLVLQNNGFLSTRQADNINPGAGSIDSINLKGLADLSQATGITVNELRMAVAVQQVSETLARGGSRYNEILRSFFDIETVNPFLDIPTELGHIRRELDLYQVAQTSASSQGSTPQGNLTAFGYTTSGGHLFTRTFLEHGYIHIFAVIRQRNVYSTYFAPDNFRLSTLDFYLPQLANIGEQPINRAVLNPFKSNGENQTLAYQEAWWEYRYEPDRVHAHMRTGVDGTLSAWNYADPFDEDFEVVTGDWLKSNAEEVLNRSLAVPSIDANGNPTGAPQFKGQFVYKIDKQRPMPTYSIPGLDTI